MLRLYYYRKSVGGEDSVLRDLTQFSINGLCKLLVSQLMLFTEIMALFSRIRTNTQIRIWRERKVNFVVRVSEVYRSGSGTKFDCGPKNRLIVVRFPARDSSFFFPKVQTGSRTHQTYSVHTAESFPWEQRVSIVKLIT